MMWCGVDGSCERLLAVLLIVTGACLAAPSPASAGWFGKDGSKEESSETKVRVLSEERGQTFVSLVSQKRVIEDDLRVIARLLKEKQRELKTFNETLETRFGIDPASQYTFDATEFRIYLLPPPPEKAGEPTPERTLHREISKEDGKLFVRHVSAKSITASQIRALSLLVREKRMEQNSANEALKGQFGIDPALDYRYEPKTRTIYRKQ